MNDSLITMPLLVVLLLVCLVLVFSQNRERRQQSLRTESLLSGLLMNQQIENQTLRNQLRSPDLMTLHALNAATLPSGQVAALADSQSDEWPPLTEEQLIQQAINNGQISYEGLSDDLNAAGWEPPLFHDARGRFDPDDESAN